MKSQTAKLCMLLLITVGGCAQIIGLSDYEIERTPGDAGEGGQVQGEGGGETSGSGGKASAGDAGAGTDAGSGGVGQGGESVQGGMPAVGGTGEGGAGGSSEVPVVVIPCDSVQCCTAAGGIVDERQLLENTDFEAGHEWWDEYSVKFGSEGLIVNEDDAGTINARAGEWFVWLGGQVDEAASLASPTIEVPADTGWITVSGYRYLVYDSTTSIADWAAISLYQDAALYDDIFYWDNYEYDNVNWFYFEVSGPGEDYAGMSFEFAVQAATDATSDDMTPTGQLASNFFFDDLSFTASRCIEPPE